MKELLPVRGIAKLFHRRFDLNPSKIGDDLPNLLVRHTNALAVRSVRRHSGARNSLAYVSEQIAVRVSVLLVRSRKIGTAATAASAESMAQSAVDAELKFTSLCRC
jgi:hypothetical protein